MGCPDWVMKRPIAHRGLHERSKGIIENSKQAALAAITRDLAIECDVQISRDGEAMVFHDETLERLTAATGRVDAMLAQDLSALVLKGSEDRILRFTDFLAVINKKVGVICEIKSQFDHDRRLVDRALMIAEGYDGPLAFKSFDPYVVACLKEQAPTRPRGIVSQSHYRPAEWPGLIVQDLFALENLSHWPQTEPHFLSWHVDDLRNAAPSLPRLLAGVPVMAWTVRTQDHLDHARLYADQMVFEGLATNLF